MLQEDPQLQRAARGGDDTFSGQHDDSNVPSLMLELETIERNARRPGTGS